MQVLPRDAKSVDGDPRRRADAGRRRPGAPGWRCWRWPICRATAEAGKAVVAALREPENAERPLDSRRRHRRRREEQRALPQGAVGDARSRSAKLLAVAAIVAEHYARGGPVDSVGGVIAGLADADPQVADAVVRGLAKGWPTDKPPKLDDASSKRTWRSCSPRAAAGAARRARQAGERLGQQEASRSTPPRRPQSLLAQVQEREARDRRTRIAAARELVELPARRQGDRRKRCST